MTTKKMNIDSKAIGVAMGEKIKNLIQNGNDLREIPNIILDVLKDNGLELPEKVQQAVLGYQQPKQS
jgi:hypothetical protein